ncbi:unnamed protein product [Sphagnum balticum]
MHSWHVDVDPVKEQAKQKGIVSPNACGAGSAIKTDGTIGDGAGWDAYCIKGEVVSGVADLAIVLILTVLAIEDAANGGSAAGGAREFEILVANEAGGGVSALGAEVDGAIREAEGAVWTGDVGIIAV